MPDFPVPPRVLRGPAARAYVGATEERFSGYKKEGLIEGLDGDNYLIEDLDKLIQKLVDRRHAKRRSHEPDPPAQPTGKRRKGTKASPSDIAGALGLG